MSTVKKAPRARKKPKVQITTPSDAEELLDWDAEITTCPPRKVQTIRVKLAKDPFGASKGGRRATITDNTEEVLDWDARIDNPPHGPVRIVKARFIKVGRRPPKLTDLGEE